jgi:hypothetical protein
MRPPHSAVGRTIPPEGGKLQIRHEEKLRIRQGINLIQVERKMARKTDFVGVLRRAFYGLFSDAACSTQARMPRITLC